MRLLAPPAINGRRLCGRASNETLEMLLTGNVKTRQLEIFNAKYSCGYRFNK